MARLPQRKIQLKDGHYIEVASESGSGAMKIHRDTKEQIDILIKKYESHKKVTYLGKVEDGKFTES